MRILQRLALKLLKLAGNRGKPDCAHIIFLHKYSFFIQDIYNYTLCIYYTLYFITI